MMILRPPRGSNVRLKILDSVSRFQTHGSAKPEVFDRTGSVGPEIQNPVLGNFEDFEANFYLSLMSLSFMFSTRVVVHIPPT
jgi:hypothetical protein